MNLQMFEARTAEGRFTKDQLKESQEILLFTIAASFTKFTKTLPQPAGCPQSSSGCNENAAIVSFNWDLVLDQLLFWRQTRLGTLRTSSELGKGPLLLKPHGSLNWYEGTQLSHVPT